MKKFKILPSSDGLCLYFSEGQRNVPSPRERVRERGKKVAFTLAEVLITLAVIGVIAAITLPPLVTNLNERINSERQANIAQKITQAMEQMRAHGQLNTPYASTDAFVDQLQNYLKIAKRCDSSHIADCWPTAKVTTADGEEYEVKNAKKGRDIKHKDNKTNNVGLVLADGASLIMTYNPNAGTIDVGDKVSADKMELPVGGGKFKEFPYTTSVTGSIDFVMDVNGAKGPNSEKTGDKYHDIRSFNGAQFTEGLICDFEVGDLCVKKLQTTYSCINTCSDTTWDNRGTTNMYCSNNCLAGAKKACSDIGMTLASLSDLTTIYNAKGTVSGVPGSGYFWSSTERNAHDVLSKSLANGDEGYFGKCDQRASSFCVGSN